MGHLGIFQMGKRNIMHNKGSTIWLYKKNVLILLPNRISCISHCILQTKILR